MGAERALNTALLATVANGLQLLNEEIAKLRADNLALVEVCISLVRMETGLSEEEVVGEIKSKIQKHRSAIQKRMVLHGSQSLEPGVSIDASMRSLLAFSRSSWSPDGAGAQPSPPAGSQGSPKPRGKSAGGSSAAQRRPSRGGPAAS